MAENRIDAEWFRRSLVEDHLRKWLKAAPTENGFFRNDFDRRWRPAMEQRATLVSQCRLLMVLATGYSLTGERDFADAVRRGAGFLLEHFRDEVHGGWFHACAPDGEVLSDFKDCYGHAFVIFGLSHAYRALGDEKLLDAARETWNVVASRFADEAGGLYARLGRDWDKGAQRGRTQNPVMHMFEALLALHESARDGDSLDAARRIAEFVFGELYEPNAGYLPEHFDEKWQPLPFDKRGWVNIGHQFEWAWLLSRAVELGLDARHVEYGRRLLAWAMRFGYDRAHGGIYTWTSYEGQVTGGSTRLTASRSKGWWQQAELIRALMHYGIRRGCDEVWSDFEQSLTFVKRAFLDAGHGGWYEAVEEDGSPIEERTRKGSPTKVGYHVTAMHAEALRLAGEAR